MSFWDELYKTRKMVVGLSPMDGVTDAAMRYMSAKYGNISLARERVSASSRENVETRERVNGGVDVLFTEFVSVDALHFATGERRERLLKTFMRARDVEEIVNTSARWHVSTRGSEDVVETCERENVRTYPYEIAQVFGNKPELFEEAALLIEKLGFDGIDINMGCPAHKVEENGSGAGLIRTPKLAQEIVRRVKAVTKLPVSVKTRIGVDKITVEEWMEVLMEVEPANIALHGRTLRQLYQGSADWEAIGRAAQVVHKHGGHILGNGDVASMQHAADSVGKYGVDGVLIGRAAEGNPGIFREMTNGQWSMDDEQQRNQKLEWMVEHAKIFETIFPENFNPMRKHLAWYCKGFEGAVEMRTKLMQTNSANEVEEVIRKQELGLVGIDTQ